MKKYYTRVIALLSLFAVVACSEDALMENTSANDGTIKEISITGEDFQFDGETRSSVTISENGASFTWDEDDVIGIFPNEGDQVSFAMDKGAGTQTATFSGGGWALKSSATYAAYYPHVYENRDMTKIPVSYVGQTQNGNNNTDHIGAYDFMAAGVSTPSNGKVAFDMQHLGCLVQLTINVKEPSKLIRVTLNSEESDFIQSGIIDLSADIPVIIAEWKSKTLDICLEGLATTEPNEEVTIYFMMPPVDLTNKSLKAVILKDNSYYQEIELTGKKFEAGKAYRLTANMSSEEENPLVINVETAGTFYQNLRLSIDNEYGITSLKVTGSLNGTDIWVIRRMAGRNRDNTETIGQLSYLDMSEANIISGGDYYYKDKNDETEYKTEANTIGDYMFYQCNLKTIKLPVNITTIGMRSFHTNTSLQSVSIPNGVEYIGMAAFSFCTNLQSIEFPETVKDIDFYAFQDCDALLSVNIPNSVVNMPRAFIKCDKLQGIHLPENDNFNVLSYVSTPIENCPSLECLTIPANISQIIGKPFEGTNIKELHVKRTIPPYLESGAIPSGTKIYVPKDCVSSYETTSIWKEFSILGE